MRHGERRASSGQSLAEFAIVVPIFLLVLFGMIDIGRYVFLATAFNHAAREGARFGSVEQWSFSCPAAASPKNRQNCAEVVARNSIVGAPPTFTVDATCQPASCRAGDMLIVKVETPSSGAGRFRFFTPVIGSLIAPPVIRGEARVVIQ